MKAHNTVIDQCRAILDGEVAVLMGGTSHERKISLMSGERVINALHGVDIAAVKIDTAEPFIEHITDYSLAFIALHGGAGENGVMQGALETLGVTYTGSDTSACVLSMNKNICKHYWRDTHLPTPNWRLMRTENQLKDACEYLAGEVMVKPNSEGSSLGMSRIHTKEGALTAYNTARQYDQHVLMEEYVAGKEYTVGILCGKALPVIELQVESDFYNYHAKYCSNNTRYIVPCGLATEQELALQQLALQAFDSVGARGWGRVDIVCNGDGAPYLLEINTVPGLTEKSLVPMAAAHVGFDYPSLICTIMADALGITMKTSDGERIWH